MPEFILNNGPTGRIEARYSANFKRHCPIALVLHSHPKGGGTMQDPLAIELYRIFEKRGFAVLRFNFRGVRRSEGTFDKGLGELEDANYVLDRMEEMCDNPTSVWVAGHCFGAHITLELLMRRPEIDGFISIAPPIKHKDVSFLAPCPSSGLFVAAEKDKISSTNEMAKTVVKVREQTEEEILMTEIKGANHYFHNQIDEVIEVCAEFVDHRLEIMEQRQQISSRETLLLK